MKTLLISLFLLVPCFAVQLMDLKTQEWKTFKVKYVDYFGMNTYNKLTLFSA